MSLPDFAQLDHRSYPLPERSWTWNQSWYDLLFAHWPVPVKGLRQHIPAELEVDTFEGTAWIGVVPFAMRIRHRYAPPIPSASYFPELNVRTYVKRGGKAGVWFFSLDAASQLAVWSARTFFYLPYHHASMRSVARGERVEYRSQRTSGSASFAANYGPTGPVFHSKPGRLEHFLTERYCLFAQSKRGQIYCGEIHHTPWDLQPAEAVIAENSMLTAAGIDQPDDTPILHFSKHLHVALWPFVSIA
ncbi:MAG: YqjF family protein [Aeoliella sp.]